MPIRILFRRRIVVDCGPSRSVLVFRIIREDRWPRLVVTHVLLTAPSLPSYYCCAHVLRTKKNSRANGARRRGSGSTARDEQAATESELDEEYVDRPKLSYKRKSSRSSIARSVFATADGPPTQNTMHAVEFRSVGGGRGGKTGETDGDGDSEGGGDDDDEPYERPKLSYGGGLRSGSSSR